jgi:hypothetical protein
MMTRQTIVTTVATMLDLIDFSRRALSSAQRTKHGRRSRRHADILGENLPLSPIHGRVFGYEIFNCEYSYAKQKCPI